jgi:hypothetical protein
MSKNNGFRPPFFDVSLRKVFVRLRWTAVLLGTNTLRLPSGKNVSGGAQHAGNHYFGLHKLQTTQLRDNQKQAKSSRPHGDEEILQVL